MIQTGSTVKFARMPDWVALLPSDTRRAYEFCLGRVCRVEDIDEQGLCVLDAGPASRGRFGDLLSDIRVEVSFLEEIR